MTFLAPWVLAVAGAAAAAVIALHLIALARPPAAMYPTARFIPDTAARAASRTSRPTDRWLLLLRVLALLLLGAAFARPVRTPPRAPMRQLLLVDLSRASDVAAARDTALARLGAGDAVILFDTAAVVLAAGSPDSLRVRLSRVEGGEASARLSAALVAAARLSTALRDSTDSVRLVLVSPVARESIDAATVAVRDRWPAAIEVVRLPADVGDGAPAPVAVRAAADDALAMAVALGGARAALPVRVVRDAATQADSTWASETGGLLVVWPEGVPDGWPARTAVDTIGAVVAGADEGGGATLVAPLVRRADAPAGLAVRARWVDGAPAAVEAPLGAGCVRTVGVPLDGTGDLVLRAAFGRFLAAMLAPCGGARDLAPASDTLLARIGGEGASAYALGPSRTRGTSLAAWPLALGLLLLLGELAVRRGGGRVGEGEAG